MWNIRFRLTAFLNLLERKTHLLQGFEYCLNLIACADDRHLKLIKTIKSINRNHKFLNYIIMALDLLMFSFI